MSGAATPNDCASTQGETEQDALEVTERLAFSDPEEIPDDDLEPHEILSRYLDLKTRLHRRRPDLTLANLRAAKALRAKSKPAAATANGIDPMTRRLLNRLKKIESDILFDQEEAEEKWMALRVELVKEEAARKKLGLSDESTKALKIVDGARNPELELPGSIDGATPADGEDPSLDLGDLFVGLPEYKVDDVTGLSGMVTTAADGKLINIRDFGKWSGIGPRRVFEEACKSRSGSFLVPKVLGANLRE